MKGKKLGIACLAGALALLGITGVGIWTDSHRQTQTAETAAGVEEAVREGREEAEAAVGYAADGECSEPVGAGEDRQEETASGKEADEASSEAAVAATGDLEAALRSEGMAQAARLIETAQEQAGTPYRFLGLLPATGFTDVSFVCYCLSAAGIMEIPVTSYELLYARCLPEPAEEGLPGDLIFFEQAGSLCHVGIYLGEGRMIHCGRRVEEASLKDGWEDQVAAFGRVCTYGCGQTRREERYGAEN
mgnify:CR=1 FL=1